LAAASDAAFDLADRNDFRDALWSGVQALNLQVANYDRAAATFGGAERCPVAARSPSPATFFELAAPAGRVPFSEGPFRSADVSSGCWHEPVTLPGEWAMAGDRKSRLAIVRTRDKAWRRLFPN